MADIPTSVEVMYQFDAVMRKKLDAVMRAWARDHRDNLARVMYEAQGYEGWGDEATLLDVAARKRRIAAYRTADAVLAYLTGEEPDA